MAALATATRSFAAATFCSGLGQFGVQGDGVHLHHHLARLDQIAFVNEDFLDPQRFPGGDIDQFGLDPAVTRDDPLGQRGSPCPPILKAKEGSDTDDNDHQKNPLHRFFGDSFGHRRLL